jgi:hypothetical protein
MKFKVVSYFCVVQVKNPSPLVYSQRELIISFCHSYRKVIYCFFEAAAVGLQAFLPYIRFDYIFFFKAYKPLKVCVEHPIPLG